MPHREQPRLPEHAHHRRRSRRRLRRVHRDADNQCADARRDPHRGRRHHGSDGQRVSYGADRGDSRQHRVRRGMRADRLLRGRHRARRGRHEGACIRCQSQTAGTRRQNGGACDDQRRKRRRRADGAGRDGRRRGGCRMRDVRRAVGIASGVRGREPGRTGSAAGNSSYTRADRLCVRDHLQRHYGIRGNRAPHVPGLAPDAPLSHQRAVRSAPRHHAHIPARQNRRRARRHSLRRRRQGHSGDRMSFIGQLQDELTEFKKEGIYKRLNYLDSPQAALDRWGAGTASVRFICGTFTVHRDLEAALARFVGSESSLTYVSCWNANEGLCATVLSEPDLVVSDQLNHASIIDAIRLAKTITKCQTAVYKHSDLTDLEEKLRGATNARRKLIFTDGIFSMEGDIAKLPDLAALARKYDAVLAVDDSHATGVLGKHGRGTAEHYDMVGEIDVITSTLGKALGGAAGGFTAGPLALTDYLTPRSRPQLFSNALPPTHAASALAPLRHAEQHPALVTPPHE